jgi:diguanylate cyclase (GGDEF)-like protein
MQISSKVAVAISLVIVLTGTLASLIGLDQVKRERREEFEKTNTEALQLLAVSVAPSLATQHHHGVQSVLDNIANFSERFPDIQELEVLDMEGRVMAALDPTRFNQMVNDERLDRDLKLDEPRLERDDKTLYIVFPLRLMHRLGVMRARLSMARLEASIERQQAGAIGLVLATMLVVGVALHFIHRRIVSERLARLSRAAAALGEGDMEAQASAEGEDEIAMLGDSFNRMATAIKLYTEDLEHLIDERTEELKEANTRLEQLATTDQLTGAWNRRYFDDAARRAIEVARRNERPLCVVLVDTDRFKSINDTYGHPVGDEVLKAVTNVLQENARKADLVARIGGEEFAILMPEAGVGLAAQAAERMRAALEEDVSPRVSVLENRPVTASFGVAAFEHAGDRLEDLLSAADDAMYHSKTTGRNRVTVAERTGADGEPGRGEAGAHDAVEAVEGDVGP